MEYYEALYYYDAYINEQNNKATPGNGDVDLMGLLS
jgi:hypothetical protein